MAWIESHQALGRHPKLIRLSALLRVPRPAAVGHLHYLWWWALDYAEDGDLERYDSATIAAAAEWPKDADTLVSALREAGWIDGTVLHDWDVYAGRLIEKRRTDAARKRDVRRMSSGRPPDGAPTAQVPTNQPTNPDQPTEQTKSLKGADAPSKSPSDIQTGLLARLHELEGWEPLTFGAVVQLNGRYSRPIVTMALQRAREENQSPNGSAYGLIESMCQDIAAKNGAASA